MYFVFHKYVVKGIPNLQAKLKFISQHLYEEANGLFVGTLVSPLFCPTFDRKTCALTEILLMLFKK